MAKDTSDGVWYDRSAHKVVTSEPVEGVQIVAPGTVVGPVEQARIDRYKEAAEANAKEVATAPAAETADGTSSRKTAKRA